jgi:hypothetical protein
MPIINKGTAFSNGEQLTADKINNLLDLATFNQSATDSASTTVNSASQIIVRDSGVNPAKLSTGAPSWGASGIVTGNTFRASQGVPNSGDSSTTGFAYGADGDTGMFQVGTTGAAAGGPIAWFLNGTERMRIDTIGRVLAGTTVSPTATGNSIFCTGRMGSLAAYTLTSGASANMIVTSAGLFERSTSSARYKENVQDYKKGIDAVKSLRPVTYESINEDDDSTYAGFIAEEVHEAGLPEFVDYNTEGQPDALHYANMTALLTKALQEAIARIEVLEAK